MRISKKSTPLITSSSFFNERNNFCFMTAKGIIEFNDKETIENIKLLIPLFNGINSIIDIFILSGLKKKEFNNIIHILEKYELIYSSNSLGIWFHKNTLENTPYISNYEEKDIEKIKPVKYKIHETVPYKYNNKTTLKGLISERKSSRLFNGDKISSINILDVVKSMYFLNGSFTVPSGGAIYPIDIYVYIINSDIKSGLYFYSRDGEKLKYLKDIKITDVFYSMNNKEMIKESSFITFVCSNLEKHMTKYSNRGYRYTLMEAGAIMQNAYLLGAEKKMGVLAYGNFNDSYTSYLLGLSENCFPIIPIIFGGIYNAKIDYIPNNINNLKWLIKQYSDNSNIIKNYSVEVVNYKNDFIRKYCASSEYTSENLLGIQNKGKTRKGYGFGTGWSKNDALIRSISESVERFYSGNFFSSKFDSLTNIKEGISPLDLGTYDDLVYENGLYSNFDPNTKYHWVKAEDLFTKKNKYIAADYVFYPLNNEILSYDPIWKASSNGVAANFSLDEATKSALFELIERDSIFMAWYYGKEIYKIKEKFLSKNILDEIDFWKRQKKKIAFFDLNSGSIPVILCTITSEDYPFFVSGAKASINIEEAMEKALDEAQYAFLAWKQSVGLRKIKKNNIKSPHDHGLFYAQKSQKDIPFSILNIKEPTKIKKYKKYNLEDLIKIYKPYRVILHKNDNYYIVRVFSKKLIQLNFGAKLHMIRHPKIEKLKLKTNEPHFFP